MFCTIVIAEVALNLLDEFLAFLTVYCSSLVLVYVTMITCDRVLSRLLSQDLVSQSTLPYFLQTIFNELCRIIIIFNFFFVKEAISLQQQLNR